MQILVGLSYMTDVLGCIGFIILDGTGALAHLINTVLVSHKRIQLFAYSR